MPDTDIDRTNGNLPSPIGNDLLSIVLDNISACVCLKSLDGRYLYANPAMALLLQRTPAQVIGLRDDDCFPPGDVSPFRLRDDDAITSGERIEGMECLPLEDGELHYFWTVKLPLRNQDGRIYAILSLLTDITARKRLEDELLTLATTDGLTGLYNRRHFLERADQTLQRSRRYHEPLVLLMCDIDFFKHINDTFGHAIGDRALQQVADIIRSSLRDTDIAGRIGGEEFAILLVQTTMEHGLEVAERLRHSIESCLIALEDNQSIPLTISIGIAGPVYPHETLATLLQHADQALYAAKRQGRNQVCLAV